MDYNQVAAFVLTQANDSELRCLVEAVKMRRTQLARRNVFTLRAGDTVSFTGRSGKLTGVISKVMQKNVIVQRGATFWRVPASMLTRVDA